MASKTLKLVVAIAITLGFSGCKTGGYLEVDQGLLQDEIYQSTAVQYEDLQPSTVLYLDHSTCIIDAVANSPVFRALRPNLGQYCDTLVLIKRTEFEAIPLRRDANEVSRALQTIKEDISFADIREAAFRISRDNQQAILISDCESYYNNIWLDFEPYFTEPFINWLKKGHSIYIIVEPYQENYKKAVYQKKRFYFLFTDNKMAAPISVNMLAQLQPLQGTGAFSVFKMTNSDILVKREGEMIEQDLEFEIVENAGYEYVSINNTWDNIREYIMKLDEYGEPLPQEKPLPIIKNLIFNDGENYLLGEVEVKAYNITSQYVALTDSAVTPSVTDISDAFKIDPEAFAEHKLNVLLTDKIFNSLTDEFGGNLIRLDFVIKNAGLKPYDADIFTWQSMFQNGQAICVSKSVENALLDIGVVPMCKDRRVIHTVFIKTEQYSN